MNALETVFSPLQISVAQTITQNWQDSPQISEGINRELCLSWTENDTKVLIEISTSGSVSTWTINTRNQKYEGEHGELEQ